MSAEETKEILKKAYLRIKELERELASKSQAYEPIAIVGGALRFAGADNPTELFELLLGGNDMVVEYPVNRWQVSDWKSEGKEEGKAYSFAASYLENIELFDNLFFNIPPEECQYTDPQQRLLLETTVEALQSAGITLANASGSRTSVFIGSVNSGYDELVAPTPTEYSPTGSIVASASGKISYKLNLKAPALTIDTACSSSLAAIHLGCKSIHSGESDVAIAGGVNLIMTPRGHVGFSQLGAMTTDGKAKVFDKDANGFSRGEGCGVVVLKKLKDAERDGDNILGIIRGSAMNHDGQSNGYTAPSQQSQEAVIQEALRLSGLDASAIGYVEAHGTGTSLGDSIELQALHKVFGKNTDVVFLGSIKANLGHTEYAAGMASVFKTLNVLRYRKAPQQIHIHQLNPHFNWASSALKVSNEGVAELNKLQYAGVSGFGISGTNVHLVLERSEGSVIHVASQQYQHVLYVSARGHKALMSLLLAHEKAIMALPDAELVSYVSSNNIHRDHFEYRAIVTGNNRDELLASIGGKLKALNSQSTPPANPNQNKLVFIFPGQGSQWLGMASGLYKHQPLFRNAIKEAEGAIKKYIDIPLGEWIEHGSEIYLKDERTIQPVLFAVQIALAKLWMNYGVKPDVLMGISMGEIAAMHVAGALTLDDAVNIICKRSQLLVSGVSGYEMCIAEYDKNQLKELLMEHKDIEVSGYYSNTTHLFSGPATAMQTFVAASEKAGIFVKKVRTSVASHCSAVNGILPELEAHLQTLEPAAFKLPVFSTVYNKFVDGQDIGANYWVDNLRLPILFNDSIATLEDVGCTVFVEISAHPLNGNYLKQIFNGREYIYQPTLFRDHDCNDVFYKSLELLYQSGVTPVFNERIRVHASVPFYAWDKQLFPIPYHNYGRSGTIGTVQNDVQVLLPEWKLDNSIQVAAQESTIFYCTFNDVAPLCENRERLHWPTQSTSRLNAVNEADKPVLVVDVSFVQKIEDVTIVLDALKEIEQGNKNAALDIVILTTHTISVTGREASLNAAGYAWLGLVRSLQTEWEHITIHWLDTDAIIDTRQLLQALAFDSMGTATIFRNGNVYRQYLHMHNCVAKPSTQTQSVLIIGGTSGMGLMMAGWYAEKGTTTIVLHGLRPLPAKDEWDAVLRVGNDKRISDIIGQVRELESKGIHVILSCGDIRDKQVVADIRNKLHEEDIQVHDIVYTAGTSLPYIFSDNDSTEFISQADTRITGWQNIISDEGIEFQHFIFISSASGLFRSIGQSPYLFANHWIDAKVTEGDAQGRRYSCIQFPIWKEIGRAAEEDFLPDTLLEHVSNADLKKYFNAIADNEELPRVVVAAHPAENKLTHLWKQIPFIPGRGLREWIKKQELTNAELPIAGSEATITDELSLLLKSVWKELLGRPEVYAHDHFFQAGGNSVLLIKLANRIKSRYPGIDIKVPELIKNLIFQSQYELLKIEISNIGTGSKTKIERAAEAIVYPASEEQKQIWIQSQLDEDASLYNLTGVYSYSGVLNKEAFSKAVHHLANEQEIFRTRYLLEDGTVVQVVDEKDNIPIEFFNVNDKNALDELTHTIFNEESAYRFDLSVEHSFRIKIASADNAEGAIILNLHHIASDGWALGYYTTRLAEVYAIYSEGQEPIIFQTQLSYKDYAVYQQQYLESLQGASDSAYWQNALSGGGSMQYLTIDNERPAIFEFHGRKLKHFVSEEVALSVKSFVEKNGISLYAFLQTCLSGYLAIISGESRIITGTPMSSRIDERLEDVVGNFVNILPVCVEVDTAKTFTILSKEVQNIVADVLLHQLYPFNRIIQDLKIKRDPSRHPVFDILFVLQNHKEADFQLQGLEIERKIIDPEHSKLDLFIEVREHEKSIEFNFEFNDRLFQQHTISGFWQGFQNYLATVLKSPEEPLGNFTQTHSDSDTANTHSNILAAFQEQCRQYPEKTAIRSEYLNVSYKALADIAGKLFTDLLKINNEIEGELKPIAVACGRAIGQVAGMLATWQAGMVYMPVNIAQSSSQLVKQVELSRCQVLICNKTTWTDLVQDSKLLSLLKFCICYTGTQSWEVYKIENGNARLYDIAQHTVGAALNNNAAYMVFTSGTTGEPKAILGRHDSLAHFINWQTSNYGIDSHVNTSWLIQPTFDASFRDVLLPLCNGGTLHIPEQETWELMHALVKWIDTCGITVIHIVPSLFRLLLNEIEAGYKGVKLLESLRYIFLSGEALYRNDIERWQHIFGLRVQLVNLYGSSETTMIRTAYSIPDIANLKGNMIAVGRPIADTEVLIINDNQQLLEDGEGNILVSTAYPTMGYVTPAGIVNPFIDNFLPKGTYKEIYQSGDIGYWDENRNLVITGRSDDQVKVHGIRMHTAVVENAVSEVFKCNQLAVVYNADDGVLVAYYQSAEHPDIPAIRQHISAKLSPLHIPDVWTSLADFPLTAHGKINRSLLKSSRIGEVAVKTNAEPLLTETEKRLAEIWSAVLKYAQIGRTDNFFELGGNSLNGLVLLSRIHKDLKRKISLRGLFANPVLADMANAVDTSVVNGLEVIQAQPVAEWYPVSQAQRRMWILHNMEENSITYNIKRAYELTGYTDKELLAQSLDMLVARQDSLRTNFKIIDGVPVQFVQSHTDTLFKLDYIDLTDLSDAETEVRKLANVEVQYNFDLEHESLLRAKLVKLDDARWVLLINMHHIISDGWSMELLMRELFDVYEKLLTNTSVSHFSLPVQYKDYTYWQQERINTNAYSKEREYWLKELAGEIPILELPSDNTRSKIKTYEGEPLYFRLNGAVKARIEELCRKHDVSLFMFLLSAVKVLLYKYTGQKDLIIGSPVAGREHPDFNGLIGFFVNMLALRSEIADETTFEEYLQQIKSKTLEGFENQSYPFDKLVEELPLQRNTSRSPLFDITVQVLNVEFWEVDRPGTGVKVKPFIADWQRSQFDLSFFFKEEDSSIFALIEFNNTIYNPKRIERLIAHFNVLLENILALPSAPINALSYLPKAEEQQLLYNNNDSEPLHIPFHTVLNAIDANGQKEDIAIEGLHTSCTYAALEQTAVKLSSCLLQYAQQNSPVAVLTSDRIPLITSMLGIMRSGNIYMPLDAAHPVDRLKYMLKDAGVEVLVVTKDKLPLADKLLWEYEGLKGYICLDSDEIYTWIPNHAELMRQDLWNYVGKQAKDDIEAGGWISSYTGHPFTAEEMEEYAVNALSKISPYLSAKTRVLEIGCSSGLTLFKVAPLVASYTGIDLSEEILIKTRQKVAAKGLSNVSLHTMYADEIDSLDVSGYDVVIINSVIQSFGGYNYFRKVIRKVIDLVNDKATLFLGDVQDAGRKEALIQSLKDFSIANQGKGYKTKITWDDELFYHQDFIRDLSFEFPCFVASEFSDKQGEIKNELSLFRFDAVIHIDKNQTQPTATKRTKWQVGRKEVLSTGNVQLPTVDATAPAYIIYTSGTTGNPKGVLVNHESLLNQVYAISNSFENKLSVNDKVLMACRSTFDVSVLEMFIGLCHGASLVEIDMTVPLGAVYLSSILSIKNITWAYLPPSLLGDIAETIVAQKLSISLNKLLVGVEPIPSIVLKQFTEALPGLQIVNGYGPTETTIVATSYKYNVADDYAIVPIGRPLPGYKVYILSDDGSVTGVGIPGEIVIAGKGVAKGYINNERLTAEKFRTLNTGERAYYTGDVGVWDAKGNIQFVGRKDSQVKFNGYRIELSEIEAQLSGYPGVLAAIVLVNKLEDGIKQLVAFIKAEEEIAEIELKQFATSRLPEFMLPQRIVAVTDFPLTTHGKTDFQKLLNSIHATDSQLTQEKAVGKIETVLLELYRSLLGQPEIGVTDNFFDLGGHSLVATRLVTRAAKEYGLSVPLVNVFIHPTVRELASGLQIQDSTEIIPVVEPNEEGLYRLSYAQNRLWIIDHLNPDDDAVRAAYNMVGLFEVKGQFEISEVNAALQLVISHHEILRTNFISVDGVPFQKISAIRSFAIEQRNIPANIENETAYVTAQTEHIAATPFQLETDILLRCVYYQGKLNSFVVVVMHHIISDGWSMHVFSQELRKALASLRDGQEYPMPEIQYKDYAAWNKSAIEDNADAKFYWHTLLETHHPPTVIPADNQRPSWRTFNGNTAAYTFDALTTAAVQRFCAKEQVTLYSFLAAAINVLIHRYAGLHTVTIGSPVSGRTHASLENQLGFYLNNIVLRNDLNGSTSFNQFLTAVHQQALQALQYQDYPFDKLVDDLLKERDAAHSPFFDIYLALQNNEAPETDFGSFSFMPLHFSRKVSRYDLNFMFEEKDSLQLQLQYNTDLYAEKTIAAICKHLYHIIEQVASAPDTAISAIHLLDNEELDILQKSAPATPVFATATNYTIPAFIEDDACNTIVYHFKQQANRYPANIALYTNGLELSYNELDIATDNLAATLIQNGVQKGDVVVLLIGRNIHRIIGILATLKAGATYLPLDTNLPETRLAALVADAGSKVLLTEKNVEEFTQWFDGRIVRSDIDLSAKDNILPLIDGDTNAYILYTSGTTGKPKGVTVTHANVVSLMKHTGLFDFSEHDTWTLFHQYNFDFTVWEIWGALLFGGKLIIVPDELAKDLDAFAELVVAQKVTVLNQTPSVFYLVSEILQSKEQVDLSSLKYVIFGGDALRPVLLQPFAEKFANVKLVNMYGITETTVHVTCKLLGEEDLKRNHSNIGKPIPTLSTYILDEYMQPVPYGMPGQLAIAGAGVTKGYLNDAELTATKFIEHTLLRKRVYLSGDLARYLPNGDLEYLGRVDHQVKIRGHRIEPGEVEYALQNNDLVEKAVVLKAGEAEMSRLLAFVTPTIEWKHNAGRLETVTANIAEDLSYTNLPNSLPLFHKNESETRFMYTEIVTEDGYMLQNLQLGDKPVIIDAGANIGMFSTLVATLWQEATIYAFEPMPEIYKCLSANAALHASGRLIALNEGLSDQSGESELHYYAMNTVMSGGGSNDKELLGDYVRSRYAATGEYSEDVISAVVSEALDATTVVCKMRTLSDVIDDYGLQHIDLVKIDVEEWEQKLMDGIRDEHWAVINNLIAEVHDIDGRMVYLTNFLTSKGFNIEAQQTSILKGVALYNLKASRAKINGTIPDVGKRYHAFVAPHTNWYTEQEWLRDVKTQAAVVLPSYMVPDTVVLVNEFPLTVNGKLDRNKLLSMEFTGVEEEDGNIHSVSTNTLLEIVAEVLQRSVSPKNNFFDIGGNSLNATQVINRIRSRMKVDLRVRDIFEHPVMKDLAACVEQMHSSNFPDITLIDKKEHYPLSDAQQRIFTTAIIDGADSVAYNMTGGLLLDGIPDVNILEQAFKILTTRHEILRTRFADIAGEFVQIPCNDMKVTILQKEVPELGEVVCRQLILQDAATPFDLQKTPLLRCALFTANGKSLLVVSMHHIISDGWSMGVMTRELATIYNSLKRGVEAPLPGLAFQYKDYCGWLASLVSDASWVNTESTFWKTELDGFETLNLPYDYTNNNVQTYKGAGITHYIEEWQQVKDLAGKENISLYAFLLATVNVLFAKVSGQNDIIIGTPVAGRPLLALEQQIGFYVNTLPVRMQLQDCKTFADALSKAHKKSVDVLEHQLYPFNRIVEDVVGVRDMGHSPLFNILFVWQNNSEPEYVLDGIIGQKVDVDYESSIFDLSFIFTEAGGLLKMTLQYNSSLFAQDTAEALVTMFNSLVIAAASGFSIDIESIEL
jgi:amino acid adenylation domain-containing protein/FkbM family methyltransferase